MNKSKNSFFTTDFSHIYIEKDAMDYPLAQTILKRLPKPDRIAIDDYKDVFARPRQNFFMQKHAAKLILAVKKPPFIYKGAEVCHDFDNEHFYYTSSALNCLYNCEYCFLQGMFPSANMVLFVNIDDYFAEAANMLKKHPVYLCISYESDLLAFESVAPFVSKWIEFARHQEHFLVELRTKSANYPAIRELAPTNNVVLAWTVSPEEVIKQYEPLTPHLSSRLQCIRQAIDDGWKVRICFDPVLHIDHWQEQYKTCIEETFSKIPAEKIHDVSVGVFRIPREYLKTIRKHRTDSALVHYPFVNREGVMSYPDEITRQLVEYVYEAVGNYVSPKKIYV